MKLSKTLKPIMALEYKEKSSQMDGFQTIRLVTLI